MTYLMFLSDKELMTQICYNFITSVVNMSQDERIHYDCFMTLKIYSTFIKPKI